MADDWVCYHRSVKYWITQWHRTLFLGRRRLERGVFLCHLLSHTEFGEDRVFNTLAESDVVVWPLVGLKVSVQSWPLLRLRLRSNGFERRYSTYSAIVLAVAVISITFRAPFGGVHTPELHADNLEGLLAQSPGIKVVILSGPCLLCHLSVTIHPVIFLGTHETLPFFSGEEVPQLEAHSFRQS